MRSPKYRYTIQYDKFIVQRQTPGTLESAGVQTASLFILIFPLVQPKCSNISQAGLKNNLPSWTPEQEAKHTQEWQRRRKAAASLRTENAFRMLEFFHMKRKQMSMAGICMCLYSLRRYNKTTLWLRLSNLKLKQWHVTPGAAVHSDPVLCYPYF